MLGRGRGVSRSERAGAWADVSAPGLSVSRLAQRAVEAGLWLLLLLAPLPFGAVQKGASFVLVAWAAALAWLVLPSIWRVDSPFGRPRWVIALVLGAGFGVLQAIPLSHRLVEVLSPLAARSYDAIPGATATGAIPLSLHPAASLELAARITAYAAIFAVAAMLASRESGAAKRLFTAVFAVGVFQAVYGSYEYLTGHQHIFGYAKRFYTDAATGTYINQNHYAGAIELSLLCGLGLFLASVRAEPASERRGRGWRASVVSLFEGSGLRSVGLGAALVVTALGLVFSYSRTGLAAASLAIVAVVLADLRRSGVRRRGRAVLLLAAAGLLFVSLAGWGRISTDLARQMTPVRWDEGRLRVWRDSTTIVQDHALTGTGLGTFRDVYPAYRSAGIVTFYDHAHNDWLELLVETGAAGALVALALLGLYAASAGGGLLRHRGPDFPLLIGGAGALLALLLHEITDFNLQIPANAALFAAIAGALLGALHRSKRARGPVVSFRAAGPSEGRPRLALGRVFAVALACATTLAAAAAWSEFEGQRLLGLDGSRETQEQEVPRAADDPGDTGDVRPDAGEAGASGRADDRVARLESVAALGTAGADARTALANVLLDRAARRSASVDPDDTRAAREDVGRALTEVGLALRASPAATGAWLAGYRAVQAGAQIGVTPPIPLDALDGLARRFAEGAVRSDPRDGRSRRRLAALMLAAGDREGALANYQAAAADPSEDVRGIAVEMLEGGYGPDEVYTCLPDRFDARATLARLLVERNLPEEAERAWRRAAELNPDDAGAWDARSRIAESQGRHAESLAHARRGLELAGSSSPALRSEILYDAAIASRAAGDPAAALDYAERSLAENPNQLFMYNVAASLRSERGDLAEAIRLWKRLLDEHGGASYVLENRALFHRQIAAAYERLGLVVPAADHYRQALAVSPSDGQARDGLKRTSRRR